ncbi:hypothetical protein TNCV_2422311 [Trichonephila clavipes]|nr:hypothetical protein TNCV_2422311 [Trichonephila clavipes]
MVYGGRPRPAGRLGSTVKTTQCKTYSEIQLLTPNPIFECPAFTPRAALKLGLIPLTDPLLEILYSSCLETMFHGTLGFYERDLPPIKVALGNNTILNHVQLTKMTPDLIPDSPSPYRFSPPHYKDFELRQI